MTDEGPIKDQSTPINPHNQPNQPLLTRAPSQEELTEGMHVRPLAYFGVHYFTDTASVSATSDGLLAAVNLGETRALLRADGTLAAKLLLGMGRESMVQCNAVRVVGCEPQPDVAGSQYRAVTARIPSLGRTFAPLRLLPALTDSVAEFGAPDWIGLV